MDRAPGAKPKETPALDGAVLIDFASALPFSAVEGSGMGPSVDLVIPNAFPPSFFPAREVVPPESGSLLATLDPKMKLEDELGLIPNGTCDACAEPNKNPVLDAELDDTVSSGLLLLLACERLAVPDDTTPDEGLDLVPVKGDIACEAGAEPNVNPTFDRPLSADAPTPPLLMSTCEGLNMPDDVAPREEGLVLPALAPESEAGDRLDVIPVNKDDTCGVGTLPNVNPTFEVLNDVTSSTLFLSALEGMPDELLVSALNASKDLEFDLKPETGESCGAGEEPNENAPFAVAVSVDTVFCLLFLSD